MAAPDEYEPGYLIVMFGVACTRSTTRPGLGGARWVLLVGLLIAVTRPVQAQSFASLLQTKRPARGVVTAIHEPGVLSPTATFRAQRVFVERQKRGVFRVAFLPKLVLEDAVLDLRHSAAVGTCLHRLAADLAADGQERTLEFRRLTMSCAGPAGWTLQAALARVEPRAAWTLERVTWRTRDGLVQNLPQARLVAHSSGRITLVDPASILPDLELAPATSTPSNP